MCFVSHSVTSSTFLTEIPLTRMNFAHYHFWLSRVVCPRHHIGAIFLHSIPENDLWRWRRRRKHWRTFLNFMTYKDVYLSVWVTWCYVFMFWIPTPTVVPFTFRLYFKWRTTCIFGWVMCFILLIVESWLISFRYIMVHNNTFLLKKKKNGPKLKRQLEAKEPPN